MRFVEWLRGVFTFGYQPTSLDPDHVERVRELDLSRAKVLVVHCDEALTEARREALMMQLDKCFEDFPGKILVLPPGVELTTCTSDPSVSCKGA